MKNIKTEDFLSFEEFWHFYVSQHLDERCRQAHFAGAATASSFIATGLLTQHYSEFLLAIIFGYGWAWFGHFYFEKNRPATFSHPLYSLRGDFKMFWLMLQGRLNSELDKFSRTFD
jgi:hypothetical protein